MYTGGHHGERPLSIQQDGRAVCADEDAAGVQRGQSHVLHGDMAKSGRTRLHCHTGRIHSRARGPESGRERQEERRRFVCVFF